MHVYETRKHKSTEQNRKEHVQNALNFQESFCNFSETSGSPVVTEAFTRWQHQ